MTELIPDEAAAIAAAERFLHREYEEFFEAYGGYDAYFASHEKAFQVYETLEIPCGWVCEWDRAEWVNAWRKGGSNPFSNVIGAAPLMVNRWTAEVRLLPMPPLGAPNYDAIVRDYINGLPPEQQEACKQRRHLELTEPIQFYPPFLDFGNVRTFEEIPDTLINLVYDPGLLSENSIVSPPMLTPRHATIRFIQLLSDIASNSKRRRATYRVVFDRDQIAEWFGKVINVISIAGPDGTEAEGKVAEYWLRTDGTVEELVPQWAKQEHLH